MNTTTFQELDLWEELDEKKSELVVGGRAIQEGDNFYNGVPFTSLITPGNGRTYPNLNGYIQSGNAIPNAYGAPLINNAG